MENRLKIMLALSLVGILLLMFLSSYLQPKTLSISEITDKDIDQQISLLAKISGINEYNNKTFQVLTITQGNTSIKGIASSRISLVPLIDEAKTYSITGIVEQNNKTLQINIQEIKNG